MSTSSRFHSEDDVQSAYDAAEFILMGMIMRNVVLVPDERQPAKTVTIQRVARAMVDAVIRSGAYLDEEDDISTLPGVKLEIVR